MLAKLGPDQFLAIEVRPSVLVELARRVERYDDLALRQVVVEITEQAVVDLYTTLRDVLAPLRKQGLRLSIDDAGAGYVSLHHIVELRPDFIKVDRSLVTGLADDHARRVAVSVFVLLSLDLGATVVAEGVETRRDLAAVISVSMWHRGTCSESRVPGRRSESVDEHVGAKKQRPRQGDEAGESSLSAAGAGPEPPPVRRSASPPEADGDEGRGRAAASGPHRVRLDHGEGGPVGIREHREASGRDVHRGDQCRRPRPGRLRDGGIGVVHCEVDEPVGRDLGRHHVGHRLHPCHWPCPPASTRCSSFRPCPCRSPSKERRLVDALASIFHAIAA